MANTEPYPLHCPECARRIPPHEDHCEYCHPVADESAWPVNAVIALCGLYFLVVLWQNIIS